MEPDTEKKLTDIKPDKSPDPPLVKQETIVIKKDENSVDYSSGESIFDNTRTDFSTLKGAARDDHTIDLWRLCYLRSMGASNIKRIFAKLHDRVVTFGTTKNINRTKQDIEKKILERKPRIVLLADHPIKKFWNILMIFLLIYVATYVPFSICFVDSNPDDPITGE